MEIDNYVKWHKIQLQQCADSVIKWSNFPKQGIMFLDWLPLLADENKYRLIIEALFGIFMENAPAVTAVLAIEARGFLLGPQLAAKASIPCILARRPQKLPGPKLTINQSTEYGLEQLAIQHNAVKDHKILVVDDVFATGGSFAACNQLVSGGGGEVVANLALIDIAYCEKIQNLKETYSLFAAESPDSKLILCEN